ncbi:MAG TPA: plasmid stabilization protein [Pricia sp.]|nr:plasmid stabilization protein [Pricia sp.]
MKVIYSKLAIKDARKIKDGKTQQQIKEVISLLKKTDSVKDISSIVKMSGHKTAYRMRIGGYRLGFYLKNNTIELARFVKRNDIYKLFP